MRRILYCVLFGIMASAPRTGAQNQTNALDHLTALSQQDQLPQLIQEANSLLANEKLTPSEQATTLTYLGHAHQRGGDFHTATTYYEKALAVLDRNGLHSLDYAATLGALATLYAETGQIEIAKHVLLRSADLLEKDGDHHAEIAMIWNDLATIAADAHSKREAHKCMARAMAELQYGTIIGPSETSAFAATRGRIAELDGDPRTAIVDYQQSLTLWKQSHPNEHPQTGWLNVLLGGAYLQVGDIATARLLTSQGLSLLEASSGRQTTIYFAAELAYSKVLDAAGSYGEASKFRTEAQASMHAESKRANAEISVAALH
jgi:tetratricopeptide (TPR) repeat protein